MTDSSLMPAIIGIAGTTIGAALGFGGGLITQLILEHRTEEAEKKNKRAEKLEELASLLYKHQHWIKLNMHFCLSGGEEPKTISPIARIKAVTQIYFPELHDSVNELDIKADQYEIWLLQERDKRNRNPQYQANIDETRPYYTAYLRSLYDILNEIKDFPAKNVNQVTDQRPSVKYAMRLYGWIGERVSGISERMKREKPLKESRL